MEFADESLWGLSCPVCRILFRVLQNPVGVVSRVGVVCHEREGEPSTTLEMWDELLSGCVVTPVRHGRETTDCDALLLATSTPLTDWVQAGMTHRLVDAMERFLAGGRPVVACGTAAIALFDQPQTLADTDAPDAAAFWADRSVTDANPWWQWPGTLAPPLDPVPRALEGASATVPASVAWTPAPAGSIRHWEWADDSPLFRPPQVTWFDGEPRAVAVVRNGPLTAVLGDAADPAVGRYVAELLVPGRGQ